MNNAKNLVWPKYYEEDMRAVASVIESGRVNYWTGDEGRKFETEFADWVNIGHAIALANGTLALDLALIALGIGEGDEVVVTPRTFIASVSSVVLAGARPVFADVDPDSGNITAASIARVLTPATKAIIPVHLAGWPADMNGIMKLADTHGLKVIEDCAQAHGAKIGDRSVGGFGHVGAWSFCQDKIMSTGGEGGMVTTNDPDLWSTMWSYKDHGKSWDAVYNRQHSPGFRWLHESFGTNWRMLEIQSAIGRTQLRRMDGWTARRTEIAMRLRSALLTQSNAIRVPIPDASSTHAYYRLYAYVNPRALKLDWSRDRIISRLAELGVSAFQGSCSEVYLEKAFDNTGFRPDKRLSVAQELGETSLMFLTHPTLPDEEIELTCEMITDVLQEAAA